MRMILCLAALLSVACLAQAAPPPADMLAEIVALKARVKALEEKVNATATTAVNCPNGVCTVAGQCGLNGCAPGQCCAQQQPFAAYYGSSVQGCASGNCGSAGGYGDGGGGSCSGGGCSGGNCGGARRGLFGGRRR